MCFLIYVYIYIYYNIVIYVCIYCIYYLLFNFYLRIFCEVCLVSQLLLLWGVWGKVAGEPHWSNHLRRKHCVRLRYSFNETKEIYEYNQAVPGVLFVQRNLLHSSELWSISVHWDDSSKLFIRSWGKCWYPWDGGPLNNQPHIHLIYIYIVGIYWGSYPLLKGSPRGVKQLGYHPKGTSIFPMIL